MSIPEGLFNAFRTNGAPTYYGPNQTPVTADVLESGLIFAFVILAFSFFCVLPGIRGKERIFAFIRITVSLYIGGVILLANFAYEWEESEITDVTTKYKAGTSQDIIADIGVHIGLRGMNITLKGKPEVQLNETINYNEHFDWRWEQGRFGFGIFAGRFNREFRAAQFRGLPFPVLWIAEYFTFDGEGIRWGRHYRQAGWYAHICMWLALPLWFLTVVLFFILLKYGAYMLMLTGGVMVIANILWASIRNFNELEIPFSAEKRLVFHYGGAFYVNLITGLLCIILGVIILILDLRCPTMISSFFGVDVLQDFDETQEDDSGAKENSSNMEMKALDQNGADGAKPPKPGPSNDDSGSEDDDEIYEPPTFNAPPPQKRQEQYAKRKSRNLTQRWQAPRRRPPPPLPEPEPEEQEIYENQAFMEDVRIKMPR